MGYCITRLKTLRALLVLLLLYRESCAYPRREILTYSTLPKVGYTFTRVFCAKALWCSEEYFAKSRWSRELGESDRVVLYNAGLANKKLPRLAPLTKAVPVQK
jgi:hypothetical protein